MKMTPFDTRVCQLGEGPLWHPQRNQLFWFDILGKRMLSRTDAGPEQWQFGEHVSAAGWTGRNTLLIASETRLFHFDLQTGTQKDIVALEADQPLTRSNDGRADPWGGFWIGTMGKNAESQAGAIYRYHKGGLRQLHSGITVPNAICFAPDTPLAYFTDTRTRRIMRQRLHPDTGWPEAEPDVFVDLNTDKLYPDGAVVDAAGLVWVAQWGAFRVAAYGPDGRFQQAVSVGSRQSSCPAFGGAGLTTLFCTSAATGLPGTEPAEHPQTGMTFHIAGMPKGQAEHRVLL